MEFSNGTVLEDLPFFNGYYAARGEPLLIGYPGYPYIKAVRNSDDDIWVIYDLSEEDTASVSPEEKGKYLSVMEERNLNPLNDRDAFESDEIFASFRPLKGGSLKENLLFRSSSPIDNTWQRAKYADELCETYGIRCIVNLADSEEKLQELLETSDSPCYKKLYEEGKVLFPEISIGFETPEIQTKIARSLNEMIRYEGPYLLHCSMGKDRSGFVSLLPEMLAGAAYQEMLENYMRTYESICRITEKSDPEKYKTIEDNNFIQLIRCIVNDESIDLKNADLVPYARAYLLSGGMSAFDLSLPESAILIQD
ncbi:MAG: tyrosine-protein phosphatase [Solobacterium sp.]|nr:tyrosine-protein phosphatase [Solobacterium sp.]